ncbi:hypothetical protein E1B28_003869 [Marasmius oreades]|uniref:Uncharacterized protein n=1 Tax=Marasmius oreades TaxID=181124 RepID=A0A9P8ABN9_9AGAR|nr:uncharacterized protein E1B28_003869 [Marasmius oreades]KAG7096432.1 hypothetical protein E1B28_003869 [Marasmius oreades]
MSSKHHSRQTSRPRSNTSHHSIGQSSSTAAYSRPALYPVRGPTTVTIYEDPIAIDGFRRRLEIAKRQGDKKCIRRMEENLRHAERPQVMELNYLGMPYTPGTHGPARRIPLDLDGFNLDFVYWDTRLIGEKVIFCCTVMPHDLAATTPYDWREHKVQVFSIDPLDRETEVTSDYLMTAVAGQRMLIKVPTRSSTSPYASRLVVLHPEGGLLPILALC